MAEKHAHLLEGKPDTRTVTLAVGDSLILPFSKSRQAVLISADLAAVETVLVRFKEGESNAVGIPILPTTPHAAFWIGLHGPIVWGPIVIGAKANTPTVYVVEVLSPECHCDAPAGFDGLYTGFRG